MRTVRVQNWKALPLVLRCEEVADILGISRSGAYAMTRNEEGFPAVRVGRRVLVPRDELRRWLERRAEISGAGG